ncbi:pentatricopeptide repeat-containing At3g18110, chloroplastic [Olea europaea subsp. europaea]|uniref:Pentatricopeptide repeat-containing At3g18110, chloroplastic n=1 Tax=Olea europaea subsp. europaea TaxID=158383 RepID=A0A8S0QMC2_OLEEU|nr:pentatricopeptide repeat-containing At3g18110, chloroplastic [Olea europaea subsp. europaea]
MSFTGMLTVTPLSLPISRKSKVHKKTYVPCCSTSVCTNTGSEPETAKKFSYSRASPSVRWPNSKFIDTHKYLHDSSFIVNPPPLTDVGNVQDSEGKDKNGIGSEEELLTVDRMNDEYVEVLDRRISRNTVKKMNKLALKRAKDWQKRVQFLTDMILELKSEEFVADVLDKKMVQMTPTDFCFLVKWVGQASWHRALEVYEWLNLRHWYSPNARMLATILSLLGKANQEALAVEIFTRAQPSVGNIVQVYNAMMGVYARNGRFAKVQELLNLMRERGCEPDLVSFNTLINARLKSGPMTPNLGIELLSEVRRSGIRPDIITYNSLISACSRESNLEEAAKVFDDMEAHKCQPDLWTYNAMISVFGRCGLAGEAERLFKELGSKGFSPDAVTYNSVVYAFAREGNLEKVKEVCEEMVKMGFCKDEMTYNTIIHMYGKQGKHELALKIYRDMKFSGRNPDAVTYTVLIDSLGKANKMTEAAKVMSEMLNTSVKPTLCTYSALICGYAKAGKRAEAEEMFDCMLQCGIKPDKLAYSVMLDIHLRSNDAKKAILLYLEMVRNGFAPDLLLYEALLRVLGRENKEEIIQKVSQDLEELHGLGPEMISSLLTKGECYDHAAKMLRSAVKQGYSFDRNLLFSILSSYSSSGRYSEATELLNFIKEQTSGSRQFITEALIVILCKANQLDAALDEYYKNNNLCFSESFAMYESLIQCCKEERISEASQIFSDMSFCGVEPSKNIYQIMASIYCRMDFPETAQHLVDCAEIKGIPVCDISICTDLIETYGKLKQLEKAESVVGRLRQKSSVVDRKAWNALIKAYAASGCYEKARAAFNTMMRDSPSPTVDTINCLLQALITDGRLNELYVAIQDLQDMGFKISKSSIVLMLDAFAQSGNIFEVKKIYHGMKAAGYLPTMHLYRVMIGLLSRGKQVRDVEAMVTEMQEAGFTPDLSIWNSMLKLYTNIKDYKKTVEVYQWIQESGLKLDEETYNTLILMYCRDCRPEEAISLMHEMRRLGLEPDLNTYKSLIAAYKAEKLLVTMKESGVVPTIATMHLLMTSYGSSGHPIEAEEVLNNLKSTGAELSTLHYSSVINAYLKNGDFNIGIQKFTEMKIEGIDPDHRIWTCFIRTASLRHSTSEAITLLTAIRDAGFDIPLRLLTEKSESLLSEIDCYIKKLEPVEDNAAFNFVNALEDLLWAFERRATASCIFQLAIKRNIYRHDVFRVADKEWGADFRKLSPGAALVGLTLWLDLMQAKLLSSLS